MSSPSIQQMESDSDDFVSDAKITQLSLSEQWVEACQKQKNNSFAYYLVVPFLIVFARICFDFFKTSYPVSSCYAKGGSENLCLDRRGASMNYDSTCSPHHAVGFYLHAIIYYTMLVSAYSVIVFIWTRLAYQAELLKFRAVCEEPIMKKQFLLFTVLGSLLVIPIFLLRSWYTEFRCEWSFENHREDLLYLHIQDRSVKSYTIFLVKANTLLFDFYAIFQTFLLLFCFHCVKGGLKYYDSHPDFTELALQGFLYRVVNLEKAYELYKIYKGRYNLDGDDKMQILYAHLMHAVELNYIESFESKEEHLEPFSV